MESNALRQFKVFVTDFRSVRSVALKASVAAPWFGAWMKVAPPPAVWNSFLTSLAECIILVWAFRFWSNASGAANSQRMRRSLVLLFITGIGSLAGLNLFSVSPGQGRERVVEGFILQPAAQKVLNATYTPDDALRDKEFDALSIWTKPSVTAVQVGLNLLWIGMFASLTVYLASFVVTLQAKHAPSAKSSRSAG